MLHQIHFKKALSWPLTICTILTRKRFSRIARLLAPRGKPREDIDAEESLDELIEKDEVVYMQGVDETCLGSPSRRVCRRFANMMEGVEKENERPNVIARGADHGGF